jgi:hypothetical protein
MKTKINKFVFYSAILGGVLFLISCSKNDLTPPLSSSYHVQQQAKLTPAATAANARSLGIASAIPAYYDSTLFKIIFVEFSPKAEATLLAKNSSINFIYQSDPGLPDNQPFISVIDAIPGDGMNPVWEEVQIAFNSGFTPRQLFSDNEVLAAAAGPNPEITLTMTGEVYYCPVIGKK